MKKFILFYLNCFFYFIIYSKKTPQTNKRNIMHFIKKHHEFITKTSQKIPNNPQKHEIDPATR